MSKYDQALGGSSRFDEDTDYSQDTSFLSNASQGQDERYSTNTPVWKEKANSLVKTSSSHMKVAGSAMAGAAKKSVPVVKQGLGVAGRAAVFSGDKLKSGFLWTKEKMTKK